MMVRILKKALWVVPILIGLICLITSAALLIEYDALNFYAIQIALSSNPTISQETAYRESQMLSNLSIGMYLVFGVLLLAVGIIGITGKGRLKRERVRVVMLLISAVMFLWGMDKLAQTIVSSSHTQLVHIILALACIVGGITSMLPIKWNRKFPIILVCTGIMVAMEIATISLDVSSLSKLFSTVATPLLIITFYVVFLIVSFKCMQLSCDFNPTISKRIEAGDAIERPPAFYEQIETFLMAKTDMLDLFNAIKCQMPGDIEVTALTDTESTIYLNADYWSAIIQKSVADPTSDICSVRFPDCKVDYQVENEYRALEEMSVALTAIEKAILTLDAQALCQVRHASSKERAARMASLNNESRDSLERFTVAGASRGAANVAVSIGGGVVDNAASAHKNKKKAEMQHQPELLILRYLGTPALPKSARPEAEALAGSGSTDTNSWYVTEAANEEPGYKMTSNRRRQLARSVAGLIAAALLTTLFMFVVNISVPGL